MDDKDILLRLLQQAYTDDALTQPAKKEYEKLVTQFDEKGAELEFPLNDLEEDLEKTLQNLKAAGYADLLLRYHGPNDGHVLHVNLRGKKYLELADAQRSVVVGMTDSGQRQTFATGAVRDTAEGKSRPDLISPFALERVGNWLMLGARKYSENNWMKGIPVSRCMASLHRHLMKYMQRDTSEDHLAALVTNGIFVLHFEEMVKRGVLPETLLDLPQYEPIPGIHRNGDTVLEHEPDEEFQWKKIHDNT